MFKNTSTLMFLMILIGGTLITISSNSWISSWMGLEINLLAFIPLMSNTKNQMSSESSMKYFLVQAIASSVLLFTIMLNIIKVNLMDSLMINNLIMMMILSSLFMKSGTAPFHFWFPAVMEGLSWLNALLLMTWQKIAPLMLISYLIMKSYIILMSVILSIILGSLGGLNQTSLRKLMAFSSINHIGWMLAAMLSNEMLWFTYFLMYSFLVSIMVIMFKIFKVYHFNQLFMMMFNNKSMKFIMFSNLLSLGGLPPFMGFLPKWLVIQSLSINNQMTLMFIMTIFTLITLFFYLRLTFTAFMLNYYETSWNKQLYISNPMTTLCLYTSFISIMGLPLVSLIYMTL